MTGYSFETTANDVLSGHDLSGKRALVTGVSSGIGAEIARALAAHGAEVVGAARDLAKARKATDGIAGIQLIEMDLASLSSVRAAADQLLSDGGRLDFVIACAGVMATPFGKTVDGFETQFGTNHLGHFLLVNRIAPLMNDGGRVVMLSAAGHRFSDVDLADPNFDNADYDRWDAYGRSKTANILFAVEFNRRHRDRGICAASVHPGAVKTDLTSHLSEEDMEGLRARIKRFVPGAGGPPMVIKTAAQGAAVPVWAAAIADAAEIGGRYCVDFKASKIAEGLGTHDSVQGYAVDADNARALWARSEELVGERF